MRQKTHLILSGSICAVVVLPIKRRYRNTGKSDSERNPLSFENPLFGGGSNDRRDSSTKRSFESYLEFGQL